MWACGPAQRAEEAFLTLSLQELAAHDLKSPSYKNSTGTTPYFIKRNQSLSKSYPSQEPGPGR